MGVLKLQKKPRAAPRLRMEDEETAGIRFTTSRQKKIFSSSIYDISESGISFVCARKYCPQIDEIIMMDFAPAGSMQLACMGRVARIEAPGIHSPWNNFPDTVKVGVTFYNLPKQYKTLIAESLKKAFSARNIRPVSDGFTVNLQGNWLVQNWQSVLATMALFIGAFFAALMIWDGSKDKKPDSPEWSKGIFEKIKSEKK